MTSKSLVGIFFGLENLIITEVDNKKVINQYYNPYGSSKEGGNLTFDELDNVKLSQVLTKALEEKKIESKNAVVSLPIKNIILRSFFMPSMPPDELDDAIEFEAKKYIPFKLEELNFDYQLFKIKEDKGKRLRILFVGIKNELLDKYSFALNKANLTILYIEPSPLSLLRALIFRGKINKQQTSAVIEVSRKGGNIIISDNAIPAFINDFRFSGDAQDETEMSNDVLLARLSNDIRLSIDYYHRHTPGTKVNTINICSEDIPSEVIESLKKEIDIPVVSIDTREILGLEESVPINLVHAFGAGIRDSVVSDISIDLYRKVAQAEEAKVEGKFKLKKLSTQQLKKAIQTGIIAAAVIFAFFLFNLRRVLSLQGRLDVLTKKKVEVEEDLRDLSKKQLQKKLVKIRKKARIFSGLQKEKIFTPLIDAIPALLPEGIWLKSVNFKAGIEEDKESAFEISGSCYTENRALQISIINQFISNLKENPVFARNFKEIDISSMEQQDVDNWLITDFEIGCK